MQDTRTQIPVPIGFQKSKMETQSGLVIVLNRVVERNLERVNYTTVRQKGADSVPVWHGQGVISC